MSTQDRSSGSVGSFVILALRVVLGGIFLWAGCVKTSDPQSFLEAIRAFRIVQSNDLQVVATYAMPAVEALAGIALILGFWSRAAAVVIVLLLLTFIGAVISAISRGLDNIPCSCFGYWHLYCEGVVGWCKVFENSVLTTIGLVLAVLGGGRLALDSRRRTPAEAL